MRGIVINIGPKYPTTQKKQTNQWGRKKTEKRKAVPKGFERQKIIPKGGGARGGEYLLSSKIKKGNQRQRKKKKTQSKKGGIEKRG